VGLGLDFQGGEVVFGGVRGAPDENQPVLHYTPRPGRAVMHLGEHWTCHMPSVWWFSDPSVCSWARAGRQLHEVSPVTGGQRYALILWTRSKVGVRSVSWPQRLSLVAFGLQRHPHVFDRSVTCPCCWMNRRVSLSGTHVPDCICGPLWN
jgi:hypothetical protein